MFKLSAQVRLNVLSALCGAVFVAASGCAGEDAASHRSNLSANGTSATGQGLALDDAAEAAQNKKMCGPPDQAPRMTDPDNKEWTWDPGALQECMLSKYAKVLAEHLAGYAGRSETEATKAIPDLAKKYDSTSEELENAEKAGMKGAQLCDLHRARLEATKALIAAIFGPGTTEPKPMPRNPNRDDGTWPAGTVFYGIPADGSLIGVMQIWLAVLPPAVVADPGNNNRPTLVIIVSSGARIKPQSMPGHKAQNRKLALLEKLLEKLSKAAFQSEQFIAKNCKNVPPAPPKAPRPDAEPKQTRAPKAVDGEADSAAVVKDSEARVKETDKEDAEALPKLEESPQATELKERAVE